MRTRPTRQPVGLHDVEQDGEQHGECGLTCKERDAQRCIAREQDGERQHDPQRCCVVADDDEQRAADDESERRAGDRAQGDGSGAKCVRPQHGEGSEHDPEAVLHASDLRNKHCSGDADGTAQTVAQPHRAQAGLRERLLGDLADPGLRSVRCAVPARLFGPHGVVIGIARSDEGGRRGSCGRRGNRPCVERTLQHIGVRLDVCSGPAIDKLSRRHRRLRAHAPEQFEVDDERRFVARLARDLLRAARVGIDECGARVVKGGASTG